MIFFEECRLHHDDDSRTLVAMSTNTCILDHPTTATASRHTSQRRATTAATGARDRRSAHHRPAVAETVPQAGARHGARFVRLLAAIATAMRRGPTPGTGPLDTPGYRALDATGVRHLGR
jgi:hypothetical protein